MALTVAQWRNVTDLVLQVDLCLAEAEIDTSLLEVSVEFPTPRFGFTCENRGFRFWLADASRFDYYSWRSLTAQERSDMLRGFIYDPWEWSEGATEMDQDGTFQTYLVACQKAENLLELIPEIKRFLADQAPVSKSYRLG
jgi:hypothetical protein